MKLSKRGEYALRLLIDLGIAPHAGRDMLQLKEVARHERIPHRFLEQIVIQLREAGYIGTKRGKFGGYFLKPNAEEVSMGRIVRLIDGPLAPISCVSQTQYHRCSCPDEEHCGLRMLMLDVRNAIAEILDRYTLGQVVEVTLRKLRRNGQPIPFSSDSRQKQSGKSALAGFGFSDFEI
ncbi:MAG: Rrf2 family transcriptional regulator [Candidatus Methylacidiphilales bacterium]|nr:Rrf2 family transcriptional regulator [Candidatus Methylacidiphilales bacterium]